MNDKKILYVVWFDDGWDYEDNYQGIEGIFDTYEAAVKFIESKKYVSSKDSFRFGKLWERMGCFGYVESMSIREFELNKPLHPYVEGEEICEDDDDEYEYDDEEYE